MESLLKLIEQLQSLSEAVMELQKKLEDAEGALIEEKALSFEEGRVSGHEAGVAEGYQKGFDEGYQKGFGEGVASVPKPEPLPEPNPEVKFTQEDLDNAVKAAVEPLQLRISDLELMVAEMPGKIEEVKRAVLNDIREKWLKAQEMENEFERSFDEFLMK